MKKLFKLATAFVFAIVVCATVLTGCTHEKQIINPDDESVKPCAHVRLSAQQGRPALCNAAGYEKYWVCLDCGTMFSDDEGITSITAPKEIGKTEHVAVTAWSKDAAGHWHDCVNCTGRIDEADHVFDREIISAEFLKQAATSSSPALYYKSCVCGMKSDTTFEVLPNVSVGKPAKANVPDGGEGTASTDGHKYGGLKYLLDDDTGTRYHTATKNAATFVIDLQSVYSLAKLSICQYDGRIKAVKISVATDEKDWENILSDTAFTTVLEKDGLTSPNDCNRGGNNTREFTDFDLSGAKARYVKIEFSVPNSNLTLFDLNIFGFTAAE